MVAVKWWHGLLLVLLLLSQPALARPACPDLFAQPSGVNPNLGAGGISPFDLADVPWQSNGWPASGTVLAAGDYYFGSLNAGDNYNLAIAAGARVTIYVNDALVAGNNLVLNSGGTASQLTLVVRSSISIQNNAQINGLLFSAGTVSIGNNLNLNGGLAANGAISYGGGTTTINRNQEAIDNLTLPGLCDSSLSLTCLADNFNSSTLSDTWVTARSSGNFTPQIVSNRLRMTQAAGNQSTSATYQRLYPAADNLVVVEFDYWAYGGNGADGIAVILSDASVTPQPGAFGGSLGYAQKGSGSDCPNCPGFAGGWLGIALDEYGNFSNPTEGRVGGPGARSQSVSIRGAAAGDYRYLAGTAAGLSPSIDNVPAGGSGHRYRITIDSTVAGQSIVSVERDAGAGFQTLIAPFNALAHAGQAPVPENFFLSFTGSTGGLNNNHEMDNVSICALRSLPVGQQIDHFEFDYSGQALTCKAETFTVRACKNASCSELITEPVTATLSPAVMSNGGWVGGNVISFSGGTTTVDLRRTVTGSTTIGVTSSVPATRPLSQTLCRAGSGPLNSASCTVPFADSGLVFDVPDGIANQPADNILLSAVKDDGSQQCVPEFANVSRNVAFWSEYIDPGSADRPVSWPVSVNSQNVGLTEAGMVSMPLAFDAQGQATISVNYADTGQVQLNARYSGSAATEDSGLIMNGADQFARRPDGLCVRTDGECEAEDVSCSVFRKAGESFPLKITAHQWQNGSANVCTNDVTPNFELADILLSHQLIAPEPGGNGELGEASYSHSRSVTSLNEPAQSISEVGVFRFNVIPPEHGYFGMTIPPASSVATGRFVPDDFALSNVVFTPFTPGCINPIAFSYMGQPITLNAVVTARNTNGDRTYNYRGNFAKAVALLQAENSNDGVERNSRLSGTSSFSWSDGQTNYNTATLQFNRLSSAPWQDGPFQQLTLGLQVLDNDGGHSFMTDRNMNAITTDDCVDAGNCTATKLVTTDVRYGRMVLDNAYGPETDDLPLSLTAEYWNGSRFVTNTLDNCSLIDADKLTSNGDLPVTAVATANNLQQGQTPQQSFVLQAPGEGEIGRIEGEYTVPAWLQYNWSGKITGCSVNPSDPVNPNCYDENPSAEFIFGRYRGNPRQIFWRERF